MDIQIRYRKQARVESISVASSEVRVILHIMITCRVRSYGQKADYLLNRKIGPRGRLLIGVMTRNLPATLVRAGYLIEVILQPKPYPLQDETLTLH